MSSPVFSASSATSCTDLAVPSGIETPGREAGGFFCLGCPVARWERARLAPASSPAGAPSGFLQCPQDHSGPAFSVGFYIPESALVEVIRSMQSVRVVLHEADGVSARDFAKSLLPPAPPSLSARAFSRSGPKAPKPSPTYPGLLAGAPLGCSGYPLAPLQPLGGLGPCPTKSAACRRCRAKPSGDPTERGGAASAALGPWPLALGPRPLAPWLSRGG
jgi:hypothetical protein